MFFRPSVSLPIASIDTTLVLKMSRTALAGQDRYRLRLRGRLESVLNWAKVRGYRPGDNPAQWRGHLAQVLPAKSSIQKTQHYAALHYSELPDFMAALMDTRRYRRPCPGILYSDLRPNRRSHRRQMGRDR